jgi:hypothetical protein
VRRGVDGTYTTEQRDEEIGHIGRLADIARAEIASLFGLAEDVESFDQRMRVQTALRNLRKFQNP